MQFKMRSTGEARLPLDQNVQSSWSGGSALHVGPA